jgi:hypothetical protein
MKEFIIRVGVFLPMSIFAVYYLFIAIGCVASLVGASSLFFCTLYGKLLLFVLAVTIVSLLYCQARSCYKKR